MNSFHISLESLVARYRRGESLTREEQLRLLNSPELSRAEKDKIRAGK